MDKARDFYLKQIENLNARLDRYKTQQKRYAFYRFFAFIAGIFVFYYAFSINAYLGFASLILMIAVFILLVIRDFALKKDKRKDEILRQINRDEIAFLQYRLESFEDGEEFINKGHPFSSDLDIFGKASLFQFLNRTRTKKGKEVLASWLLNPEKMENLSDRQNAIEELRDKTGLRQQFQAHGIIANESKTDPSGLEEWLLQAPKFKIGSALHYFIFIFPCLTLLLLILSFLFLPVGYLVAILFINFWILFLTTRKVSEIHQKVSKSVKLLGAYGSIFKQIEEEDFKCLILNDFQTSLIENKTASQSIKELSRILGRLDFRLNMVVAIPLNLFLLWDLHHAYQLGSWKMKHRDKVLQWFDTLAAMEAYSSLATLAFNKPHWHFPTEGMNEQYLQATSMGHPLIPEQQRVNNDFQLSGAIKMILITGSNMSGKTTFLRTIGVNLILAMIGCPVPATSFHFKKTQIRTSMRIADSLTENTSSFYAELKRLKQILEAVKNGENCLLLLDEILKGTNSVDRHKGSEALIRQLVKYKAVGLLATHDLDLSVLETELPLYVTNYNFDVQIEGDELYFDYKIHPGICKSMNASLLMKKMGIEM